jgi:transcriptional regulator with XRE-family HTH domain
MQHVSGFSGAKLESHRRAQGLSRERLALAVNRSYLSIRNWELGETKPSADMVATLAATLGCRTDDLYEVAPEAVTADASLG